MPRFAALTASSGRLRRRSRRAPWGQTLRSLVAAAAAVAALVGRPHAATAQDSDADGLSDAQEISRLATVPFGPQQIISTAAHGPRSIAAADLDGDGDLDLLSASWFDDTVAWYENRLDEPSADFGPLRVISSSTETGIGVLAVDLDGDGDPDVLSTSYLDGGISWHENRLDEPSADFAAPSPVSTEARDRNAIFAADLDGDGDADVLGAGSYSSFEPTVAWYENRLDEPSADFGPRLGISQSTPYVQSIFAADLDGDGDPDVLAASSSSDSIAWYENRLAEASADFGPQQTITTAADSARSVFAADLDGDGDPDALSASYADDKIAWYENRLDEGPADFGPQQLITAQADGAWSVFAADLDADGDADAVSGAFFNGSVAWHENRLGAASADFAAPRVLSTGVYGTVVVIAADLDGDGDSDVVFAAEGDSRIAWHENPGTDPFDPDSDDDGLADGLEVPQLGTDPLDPDSDDDGVADGREVNELGSDPLAPDSDGDGLWDGKEVDFHATDPAAADTDGDGFSDDREVRAGSDPGSAASTPPAPQPALFQASFVMHAFGHVGPRSIVGGWSPDPTDFVALPLGRDCRSGSPFTYNGAPAGDYCPESLLREGRPATGAGLLGLGGGAVRPIALPQSAFRASGISGRLRDYYYPFWERQTYAAFANAAGSFFAGGGPAAGRGTERRAGSWPGSWIIREGRNGFGGALGLLGRFGARVSWGYWSAGVGPWSGTTSWNMIRALGRSPGDPSNPYTNTAVFTNPTPRGFTWTVDKRGSGTPWTTGSVTFYVVSRSGGTRFTTTLRRAGYDKRNSLGTGTIQLVTPAVTHWRAGPGRPYTGHVGILKLRVAPEPGAVLLLAGGLTTLALLKRGRC